MILVFLVTLGVSNSSRGEKDTEFSQKLLALNLDEC